MRRIIREIWYNYKEEVWFFVVLSICVAIGHWCAQWIPVELFDNIIAPLQNTTTTTVCLLGAYVLFRHSDGLRIRTSYAWSLLAWGLLEAFMLLQTYFFHVPVFHLGTGALSAYTMLMGNFLGWLLLVYPTESLRPGWLTWKTALWQLLPMVALVVLDYFVPWDLRWLISMYPLVLFIIVCTHIRRYRRWCEENYSTMDHIDAQWIVRYLSILFVIGVSYGYMYVSDNPCRSFTQNILLAFLFGYSSEQILFRKDPWEGVSELGDERMSELGNERERLEKWMKESKPYLHPEFQLMDLRAVLPMNRTYLSRYLRDEFGCTFYQFVNNYRIEEAKRLLTEQPDMKMSDVAAQCGFSSQSVFSNTFTRETGVSPREWSKNFHSA